MDEIEKARYSVSQITQGKHKFYTLTIPSDILAKCCFVTTREEDPQKGFQRVLDKKRAEEIAAYIDSGLGTIPSSIILSAQKESELEIIGKGKTAQFNIRPDSFLILDGQHRVYGFSLAKSEMRVPVVIYNNLTRAEESRLFIDINSKQKGVPNELLLDIKKLAEIESSDEEQMRFLFDKLNEDNTSCLFQRLSPSSKSKDKISRVTFNSTFKSLMPLFINKGSDETFSTINNYYSAVISNLKELNLEKQITNTTIFKAFGALFPIVASKVKDRFGPIYNADNFNQVLEFPIQNISISKIKNPGTSFKELASHIESKMKSDFSL